MIYFLVSAYVLFSYLFMAGYVISRYDDAMNFEKTLLLLAYLISPVTLPIIIGYKLK